jgi:PKD domain-containing protein
MQPRYACRALAAMLTASAVLASTAAVAEAHPLGIPSSTSAAKARGLVFRGLKRKHFGRCAGGYQILGLPHGLGCTHGPDPAPSGVDVRKRRTIAQIARRTALPPRKTAASPPAACIGDGQSGARVELVYAVASYQPDRYSAVVDQIRGWAGDMAQDVHDSALETAGDRTLRFVTANCEVVVDHVVLSSNAMADFGAMADALRDKGFNRVDRDYVVFADANVYCGIGEVSGQFARADNGCWSGEVALHELTHNLGAVQLSAPNSSGGYHCTDESDVMCYSDEPDYPAMQYVCPPSHERLLDCNHDDYFSTAPVTGSFLSDNPDFNVADSEFMAESDGAPPVHLPAPPDGYSGPSYTVRAYNADDDLCVYAIQASSGRRVRLFCVGYGGDRTADVTGALLEAAGGSRTAELELVATDRGGGRAVGFTVVKNGTPVLSESDGEAGSTSSAFPLGTNDPSTGWPAFYDKTLDVSLNSPPAARFIYAPRSPSANQSVNFTSQSSKDGAITAYDWDFGDGDTAQEPDVSHTFTSAGTYIVTLTVTDDAGQQSTVERSITVDASATARRYSGTTWQTNPSTHRRFPLRFRIAGNKIVGVDTWTRDACPGGGHLLIHQNFFSPKVLGRDGRFTLRAGPSDQPVILRGIVTRTRASGTITDKTRRTSTRRVCRAHTRWAARRR